MAGRLMYLTKTLISSSHASHLGLEIETNDAVHRANYGHLTVQSDGEEQKL